MPIDTPRPEYVAASGSWQKCRDCFEGSAAVKARRQQYLPALSTENDPVLQIIGADSGVGGMVATSGTGYAGYLMRAPFYNATERTVQGLTGTVFRLPPVVNDFPAAFADHLDDLTQARQSFEQVASDIFMEQMTVARVGVLLDMPKDAGDNARPYWVFYNAEQITWWKAERRGGDQVLTGVVLREAVERASDDDPFVVKIETQYRHLRLVNGVCVATIYTKTRGADGREQFVAGSDLLLTRRGIALDFVPFLIFGARYIGVEVDKSPIEDLVEENLSHFRSSADLEHGLHWTALPTPWIACQTDPGDVMTIGSSSAWNLGPGGTAGMLEFSGAGLGALAARIKEKEHHMSVLGAKLLEAEPTQQEAAETVRLRHSGEGSVLRRMAATLEVGLQTLIRWHLFWSGAEKSTADKVTVGINREFLDERMTPTDLQALVLSWQAGAVSWNTVHFNARRGGIIPPGITEDQERELILADASMLPKPEPIADPAADDPAADGGG